jgi:hypothetical protein
LIDRISMTGIRPSEFAAREGAEHSSTYRQAAPRGGCGGSGAKSERETIGRPVRCVLQ